MSIEARQIQKTLYSYATILNFTPSPQGLRAKFGTCSVQNAQLFMAEASLLKFHLPTTLREPQYPEKRHVRLMKMHCLMKPKSLCGGE